MSVVYQKIRRDLLSNKTRTLLVVLSTAVGIFALGLVLSLANAMSERMTREWQASQPPHIYLRLNGTIGNGAVTELARTPGVTEVEPMTLANIQWKLPSESEWRRGDLTARRDYQHQQQNIITIWAGAFPQYRGLAVERHTADAYNLTLRSPVMFKTDFVQRTLQVTGIVRDLTTEPPQFGGNPSFLVTRDTMQSLTGLDGFNQLLVRLPQFDSNQAYAVAGRIKKRVEKLDIAVNTPFIQDPQQHFIQQQLDAALVVMGALGALSLALSTFLIVNTINAVLAQQVSQIGAMKAVGATTSQIVRVYLTMVLIYGTVAVVLAAPLSALAAHQLAGLLLNLMNIEPPPLGLVPQAIFVQFLVGLLTPMLAALLPVLSGARITVRQAIASYGLGSDFGQSWVDRVIARLRGLPRPLALSLRNSFRRKGRITLTLLTLALAGAMFIAVMSLDNTFNSTLDRLFVAYRYDAEIDFHVWPRSERANALARNVPGVTASEVWIMQSGTLELGGDRQEALAFLALPANSTLFQPTITAGRWLRADDGNALVLNQKVAQDEGLRVGDRVVVNLGPHRDSTWEIIGLLLDTSNDQHTAVVPLEAFGRALQQPDRGNTLIVATAERTAVAQAAMAERLRAMFEGNAIKVSGTNTSSAVRQQTRNRFNIITYLLLAMTLLAGGIGSLGLMGTMSINVLERSKEIGVLRALGASSRDLIGIFVAEGIIIGLLSAVIAIPLSYPGAQLFSDQLGNRLFQMPLNFRYSLNGLFIWLAALVCLSALASLLPALRAARLSVRATLAYE